MEPFVTRRTFMGAVAGVVGNMDALASSVPSAAQQSAGPAGRVDVHHHILPPVYIAAVGREMAKLSPGGAVPTWSVTASLELMDRQGIDAAVVSVGSPGVWTGDPAAARKLARQCNEFAAKMVVDHPSRFGVFATLPLPDVEGSLAELAYSLDTLKCDGVGLLTNYGDQYLGGPQFTPLMAELHRRRAVVHVHPNAPSYGGSVIPVSDSLIEYPHQTTRAVLSLMMSGVLERFPDIRFIFSHGGGTVPFLASRIANGLGLLTGQRDVNASTIMAALQRLYYDGAASVNAFAFPSMLRLATAQHIMCGTDFPFVPAPRIATSLSAIRELGLAPSDIQSIEDGNARGLFPRLARAA